MPLLFVDRASAHVRALLPNGAHLGLLVMIFRTARMRHIDIYLRLFFRLMHLAEGPGFLDFELELLVLPWLILICL